MNPTVLSTVLFNTEFSTTVYCSIIHIERLLVVCIAWFGGKNHQENEGIQLLKGKTHTFLLLKTIKTAKPVTESVSLVSFLILFFMHSF